MKKLIDVSAMFPELSQIEDQDLRSKVVKVWNGLWEQSKWEDINDLPTSEEIPYPHLPHHQAVVSMAVAIADVLERTHNVDLNRDYLIAAAILQDASKVVEFSPGPDGKPVDTEIGEMYPHPFWAAHAAIDAGVPGEVVNTILHHSPKAARFPKTLEGKILFYVDQIDVLAIYGDRWRKELMITK